jgi:hypothetical protein
MRVKPKSAMTVLLFMSIMGHSAKKSEAKQHPKGKSDSKPNKHFKPHIKNHS